MTRTIVARLVLAAACGLAAAPAFASGWNYPLDDAPFAATIFGTSANAQGQFWATASGAVPSVYVRYDNGVSPALALQSPVVLTPNAMLTTDHGDFVTVSINSQAPRECRIVKYFADGVHRWTQTLPDCASGEFPSARIWAAPGDGLWLALPTQVVRLGADGRVLKRIDNAALTGRLEAVDTRTDTLYASGTQADGAGVVAAYDRNGTSLWRTRVDAPVRIAVAGDGSLRAVGTDGGLFVAALGADGALRWSTLVDPAVGTDWATSLVAPVVDANGAAFTLGAADAAIKVDAAGQVAWRVTREAIDLAATARTIDTKLAPNGDLMLAYAFRIARIDTSGQVRFTKPFGSGGSDSPATGIVTFGAVGEAVLGLRDQRFQRVTLARVGIDGTDLPAPEAPTAAAPISAAKRAPLADGSVVVWTNALGGTRELLRIAADGTRLWRAATPGRWSQVVGRAAPGAIAAAGTRVCTLDATNTDSRRTHVLNCFRTDNGNRLWSLRLAEDGRVGSASEARVHVAADGSVSAWYAAPAASGGNAVVAVRVDRDGNEVASVTHTGADLVQTSPADAPFALLTTSSEAFVVDAAGTERYRFNATYERLYTAGFSDDGGLVALTSSGSRNVIVLRYTAAGQRAWATALPVERFEFTPPAFDASAVYVATCCDGPDLQYRVARIGLADGESTWRRTLALSTGAAESTPMLALTPERDAVVAVSSPGRTVDVDVFAARDGAVRGRLRERCRGETCYADTPFVTGNLRVHVAAIGVVGGSALMSWPVPGSVEPVRIDQVGLTGAWWSPYADGEGFVLDYLPDSRTLFMPWFTYSRTGGNDPSELRWYAVQGAIAPNATSAELVISEATGGAFNSGPVIAARRVGTATLQFTDCSNGTMSYVFDDGSNAGARGSITLTRLSPATESCILANGTIQPGAGTRPAENGFDARMSGSWFQPATSGQGLQFVVQPGAYLFIPWFTYDPADAADDPGAQRWFTLQGSLADARDGVVEVPIAQTIGGAFDRVPTNNANLVGKATLRMLACDRARVDYRFDDSDLAGAMRNRTGSMDLDKIGGCATP